MNSTNTDVMEHSEHINSTVIMQVTRFFHFHIGYRINGVKKYNWISADKYHECPKH